MWFVVILPGQEGRRFAGALFRFTTQRLLYGGAVIDFQSKRPWAALFNPMNMGNDLYWKCGGRGRRTGLFCLASWNILANALNYDDRNELCQSLSMKDLPMLRAIIASTDRQDVIRDMQAVIEDIKIRGTVSLYVEG